MRIERHHSGVWVREDGCIYLPKSGKKPAHWTFGWKQRRGYLQVQISGKSYLVHRLVAECYIPNTGNKPQVDHINRNKGDNRVENLRWATNSDNQRNTIKNDRIESRGRTHRYEDYKQFCKERTAEYRKTHKCVIFSNGKSRWLPTPEALPLLAIPVSQRIYIKQ